MLYAIFGTGRHLVVDVPKPGEEAAAIKCVGSKARLRTVVTALADYFEHHPSG